VDWLMRTNRGLGVTLVDSQSVAEGTGAGR
jgi:hypothetical protein